MNKYLLTYIKAILAGIFIGLAAVVYCFVSGTSTILASCLFAFALLTILELRFSLFTGKIGFLNKTNWLHILITLIGNIVGVFFVATLLHYTQYGVVLYEICARICTVKLSGSLLSTLILSFFCGFFSIT